MNKRKEKTSETDLTGLEVAIIGYAGRFNNCKNVEEYWNNLSNGKETFHIFQDDELKELGISEEVFQKDNYVKSNGVLDSKECFDTGFFGYTPTEANVMDPQIRIFHEIVWEGLEMSGYTPSKTKGKIGLYASASNNSIWQSMVMLDDSNKLNSFASGYLADKDFMCSLVSYNLNLKGPAVYSHTACSSSLVAIHQAARALQTGDCQIAVAGGVSASLVDAGGYEYHENLILSPDGHCKAFDADAKGTVNGEGGGVVILKRYRDAVRDNDTIYGVIKGSAINNDGNDKIGYSAPSVNGQRNVIRSAIRIANVDPNSVSYIETHGTGTKLGDPIEIDALKEAYKQADTLETAIGSVKTNIGHLDTAAGVASLIKVILMMRNKKIPANLHYTKPNPNINFKGSSFYVNNQLKDWKSDYKKLRAGVSSFGIGGTNCHIIVEEPNKETTLNTHQEQAYPINLSGKNTKKLDEIRSNLAEYLERNKHVNLSDISYTLNCGRADFKVKKSFTATTTEELISKLKKPLNLKTDKIGVQNKSVFVFSGQGSQYLNMGKELYKKYPVFRKYLDNCFTLIEKYHEIALKEELFKSEKADDIKINETLYTQLSLFSISYSLAKFIIDIGVQPSALIGHSIGEYAGAVISGVIDLDSAIQIVGKRAKLMQQVERGEMYAVFANEETLKKICPKGVSIAAINTNDLTVISGNSSSINEFVDTLKSKDIYTKKLKTSHAFHSAMMDEVLEEYTSFLKDFSFADPRIPLISNVSGQFFEGSPKPEYWSEHLRSTVLFANGVNTLISGGYDTYIEVGPGNQLTKLINKISGKNHEINTVDLLNPNDEAIENGSHFLGKISELWQLGNTVNWHSIYESENNKRIYLPTYPFDKTRFPLKLKLENLIGRLHGSTVNAKVEDNVSDWLYTPSWVKSPIPENLKGNSLKDEKILVFCDDKGSADKIIKQFEKAGSNTIIRVVKGNAFKEESSTLYTINYNEVDTYKSLFENIKNNGDQDISRIIHCVGVNDFSQSNENLDDALHRGYLSLTFLAKELLSNGYSHDMSFVVFMNETTKVEKDDTVIPLKTMSLGALKIISVEYDNLKCKMIDIVPSEIEDPSFCEMLTNEIGIEDNEDIIISYRNNKRYIYSIDKVKNTASDKINLYEDGCYLITGGFGGMGLSIAQDIAKREKANLVLVTRREFPAEDKWDLWLSEYGTEDSTSKNILKIKEMQGYGAKVMVLSADVADKGQMKNLISNVENKFGKINGVIWAAGVIDYDGVIQNRNTEKFLNNIKSKVHGLLILEEILDFEQLDFVALFSSIGNLYYKGKFGQVAYNVANEFFDAYSLGYTGNSNIFTIDWCDWKEVGMTVKAISQTQKEVNESEISELIEEGLSPEEGVKVFRKCLVSTIPSVIISKSDLIQSYQNHKNGDEEVFSGVNDVSDKVVYERPDLSTPYSEPTSSLEKTLVDLCCALFGIDKVGIDDNFLELGGDSLAAIQFINQIKQQLNTKISLEEFFTNPTMKSFAKVIQSKQVENKTLPKLAVEEKESKSIYPLLPSQKRMFILHRLYPEQTNYNQVFIFKTESVDPNKLQKVFELLIQRHQVLRASFKIIENEPKQEIHENVQFKLEEFSIQNDQGFDKIAKEFQQPFDLSKTPLFRAATINNFDGDDYLLIDIHHIISDGRSNQIFLNDLMRMLKNEALEVVEEDFTTYVEYFNSEEVQEELIVEEKYWQTRFTDYVPAQGLITDFPRHLDDNKEGGYYQFKIDQNLSNKVVELAKKEEVTLFTFNLAVFYVLMSKLTNESDIIIGTTHLGRNLANFDNVMGMFIETMALRNNVDQQLTFHEFIKNVKSNVYRDFDNRKYPFENLVDKLDLPKNKNRNPLFDVVFSSDDIGNRSLSRPTQSSMEIEQVEQKNNKVSFDILFTFSHREDGLSFSFEYNSNLFRKETIASYGEFYKKILELVLNTPEISVGKINLLTEKIEFESINNSKHEKTDWKDSDHIFNMIDKTTNLKKNSIAVVDAGKETTYEVLMSNVDKLAFYLQNECNIAPGDTVGIYNSRSTDLIISILATMKARAVFVPIDISFPEERVKYILDNAKAKMVLTNTENMFNIPYFEGTVFALDVQMETLEEVNEPFPFTGSINDLAYILFTSGSTGHPKGVKVLHKGLSNYFQWANRCYFDNQESYDLPLFTSISFDFTLTSIFSPLLRGSAIHIYEDSITVDKSLKAIFLSNLKAIKATPAHIDVLASLDLENTKIENIILGGEALLPHHISILKRLNQDILIFNEYGPTEATIACSASRIIEEDKPITIGKQIDNTQIHILDENLNSLPNNVPGEIYISGDGLSQGYIDLDITNEKFKSLPQDHSVRVYKTGDKGYYNSLDEIVFLGRIDTNEQVKIRGYRVELKEIENVLSTLEEVDRAVVSVKKLNDEDVIVAYYSSKKELEEQKIRSYLMKYLPQQMIPGFVIYLDTFPLTTNGKVNYDKLPIPEISKKESYIPPVNETEIKLVSLWEEILNVDKDIIGINDSFFSLGGNSLKIVQLSQKMENDFGVSIPVAELFDFDTISSVIKHFFTTEIEGSPSDGDDLHDISIDLLRKIND